MAICMEKEAKNQGPSMKLEAAGEMKLPKVAVSY